MKTYLVEATHHGRARGNRAIVTAAEFSDKIAAVNAARATARSGRCVAVEVVDHMGEIIYARGWSGSAGIRGRHPRPKYNR